MRSEDLQEVIRAAPFRPFAIVFADGNRVVVRHPEWILFQGGRQSRPDRLPRNPTGRMKKARPGP